jgi:PKD repeat protein
MTYRPRYEPNEELLAAFAPDVRDGHAPLTVTFTNITQGDAASAQWEFGDGTIGKGLLTTTHIYAKEGVYTVTLHIQDRFGNIDTDVAADLITVNPPWPTSWDTSPRS